jgi:hypothetical protein
MAMAANADLTMGPTAMKACADEANALCALRDSCGPNYEIARVFGMITDCQTRTAQVCVNALAANGTGNTPTGVEACAAAYPSEQCNDFFNNNPVGPCVPPMGTLTMGAPCGASGQCASGYCAVPQYQVCGTCQPIPVAGASCQVEADCGRDMACAIPTVEVTPDAGVPTTGKCVAFAAVGAPCLTGFQPCQNGSVCVGETVATMTKGTCQAQPKTVGAACDASRKTAPNCNGSFGMVCIPSMKGSAIGTCQAIMLVGPGATCGDIGAMPVTGFAVCQASGLCKKAVSTDTSGTCVAAAADGAACDNDPANGPPCLAPARCVIPKGSAGTAGTCALPNASSCN